MAYERCNTKCTDCMTCDKSFMPDERCNTKYIICMTCDKSFMADDRCNTKLDTMRDSMQCT